MFELRVYFSGVGVKLFSARENRPPQSIHSIGSQLSIWTLNRFHRLATGSEV